MWRGFLFNRVFFSSFLFHLKTSWKRYRKTFSKKRIFFADKRVGFCCKRLGDSSSRKGGKRRGLVESEVTPLNIWGLKRGESVSSGGWGQMRFPDLKATQASAKPDRVTQGRFDLTRLKSLKRLEGRRSVSFKLSAVAAWLQKKEGNMLGLNLA